MVQVLAQFQHRQAGAAGLVAQAAQAAPRRQRAPGVTILRRAQAVPAAVVMPASVAIEAAALPAAPAVITATAIAKMAAPAGVNPCWS